MHGMIKLFASLISNHFGHPESRYRRTGTPCTQKPLEFAQTLNRVVKDGCGQRGVGAAFHENV